MLIATTAQVLVGMEGGWHKSRLLTTGVELTVEMLKGGAPTQTLQINGSRHSREEGIKSDSAKNLSIEYVGLSSNSDAKISMHLASTCVQARQTRYTYMRRQISYFCFTIGIGRLLAGSTLRDRG